MSPLFEREPNFEDHFKVGDRFVLMGLQYMGPMRTKMGLAERSVVTAITRESYPARLSLSVIGVGFKNMAERATVGDFPVVVEYIRVPLSGGREVKRLAPVTKDGEPLTPGDWKNGENGDPVNIDQFVSPSATTISGSDGDESPGF